MKQADAAPAAKKGARRQLLVIFLALLLVAALGVFLFLWFYGGYIDRMLYAERLSQMREVTGQLFAIRLRIGGTGRKKCRFMLHKTAASFLFVSQSCRAGQCRSSAEGIIAYFRE